jgi:hypothetical protein
MAVNCDPAALTRAAACMDCIPKSERAAVELYLLAVLAKGSLDPATLVRAARCMNCIPRSERENVKLYLMCQVATAAGA